MERLEYIDDYFKRVTIPEKESDFEQRLLTDKEFAQEVAFYLSTLQVARTSNDESKKSRFKEIYYQNNSQKPVSKVRELWPYAAMIAAVFTALFFGIYLFMQPEHSTKLADTYLINHLQTVGVQMGNTNDLLQQGKNLYNDGSYSGSLKIFEELLQKDTLNYDAKEYAGIAALRLQNYEKALQYFHQVANNEELTENPGKFYQALTLMKRHFPGDEEKYKDLLNEVINEDLFGKDDAVQLLKKLH